MSSTALLGDPVVKELIICPLCSKFFEDPRVLPCQHTFCLNCLNSQFKTSHSSSRVRLNSLRCPTCFTTAAIPLRGMSNFPCDHKVEKIKELVDGVMMQGILRKSRIDILEGRTRGGGGTKSRPSSWTGNLEVFNLGSEGANINDSFPMTDGNIAKETYEFKTKEVGTDTSDDDTLLGNQLVNHEKENCGSLQDCGIQTELCDVTKYLEYDKVNKQESYDNIDTLGARKRSSDVRINYNGVSHGKRTCHDSESKDNVFNCDKNQNYDSHRQEQGSSDLGEDFEVNNDVLFSTNKSAKCNGSSTNFANHIGRQSMDTSNVDIPDSDGMDNTIIDNQDDNDGQTPPSEDANSQQGSEVDRLEKVYKVQPTLLWNLETQDYNMPTSVTIAENGNIIVSEYGNNKLQFFEGDGTYIHSVDEVKPYCAIVNKEGNIVVADRKDKTIKVYHPSGELYYDWDKNSFHWISGLGITSSGNFVVFDREDCKVGVFTPEGEKITEFGHYGDGDSQLCMADFLTVDAHDRILICDSGHHCVKVFDLNGGFLGKFGERGTANGYLLWPKSVCVDSSNNILVTDQRNNRINLYSEEGHYIQNVLSCTNPYGIGYHASNKLAVSNFNLAGSSSINIYQL